MAINFPEARDAHVQLLYDRRDFLYGSDSELNSKFKEVINCLPKTVTAALEHLQYQYLNTRLQILTGAIDSNGIFSTTVPYDAELMVELNDNGGWSICVAEDEITMEISTHPLDFFQSQRAI